MLKITQFLIVEISYRILNKIQKTIKHDVLPPLDDASLNIYKKLSKKEMDMVEEIIS